ncbi:MAG: DUF502 domain-containing protein [Planctomycetota bacterium]|jgi:uncharacterized membrane protein
MSFLRRIFLSGLAVLLPTAATIYLLWWIADRTETLLGGWFQRALPGTTYLPGMGVIAALALVCVVGLLTRMWLLRGLIIWGENLLARVPIVKSLFTPLRDVVRLFAGNQERSLGRTVLVELGPAQAIGFMTREGLDFDHSGEERVAVYLPLGYQIGGQTLLLPRRQVRELDIPVEEAMRFAITAGVTGLEQQQPSDNGQAPPCQAPSAS